jgi:hypothetical protein
MRCKSRQGYPVGVVPLAHVGHYLWVLYLPPIVIVLVAIIRSTIAERRNRD